MTSPYKISVIISTYDDRELVDKKLKEIRSQSLFFEAEFIFVESDSPGRERELITPFCEAYSNCRLITLDERVNLYRAWNLGWNAAKSPYVCISNMDDAMHPELLKQVSLKTEQNDWDLASVLVAQQRFDDEWNSWRPLHLVGTKISTRPGPFFFWKNKLKDTFGQFDEQLEIAGDKDFWARSEPAKLKLGLIPKILYLYTNHANQLSKQGGSSGQKIMDRQICAEKPYEHRWPRGFYRKAHLYRIVWRIPILRSFLLFR